MKKTTLIVFAAAVALSVSLVTAKAADEPMPSVGQMAPTFTLPSQDGNQVSLDSFRGKWVVLYFYPKDMTQGCTIEAHNFQRDQAKYEALNAAIVGVSVDTPDSHKQFCTKEGLTFKLLADPAHKVVDEYGSLGHFGDMTIANAEHVPDRSEGKDREGVDEGESASALGRSAGGTGGSAEGLAESFQPSASALSSDRRAAKWKRENDDRSRAAVSHGVG